MKNYSYRVKRLEKETGASQATRFMFLHYSHRPLEMCLKQGRTCFKKGNFRGIVKIYTEGGNEFPKGVDSESPEGIEVLKNHGYEVIKPEKVLVKPIDP